MVLVTLPLAVCASRRLARVEDAKRITVLAQIADRHLQAEPALNGRQATSCNQRRQHVLDSLKPTIENVRGLSRKDHQIDIVNGSFPVTN